MLEEALPATFREALIIVGVVLIAAGLIARERAGVNKGLGDALMVVGVLMIVAWPFGHMLNWW